MSTLSVREAIYYSAHLQLPDTMLVSEKRTHAEHVIQEMGLDDIMDTRIGGRITKGISGGQRKRVSICVEMLTRPRLLFLDEPTSGLDSAASYHVMSHITSVAAGEGMTVVAAVHQPGEVFELFHSLCLLAHGRTVFLGTVSDATEFFNLNGFPCPCLRNPSEHFLGTINKDFDEEIVEDSRYRRKTAAKAIDTLTNAYQSSAYLEKTTNQIIQMKEMVFRRERLSGHYGVTEFVISNTLSATPYLAVMIIIPGAILYYLTGLTRGGSNIAYFVVTLYTCIVLVESIMMVIAAVVPDFLMGIVVGSGVQALMMTNGGFFRLPNQLPKPVWKYPCYYISFHKYAVQGFYKNEFVGQTFASDQLIMANATITGHQVLEALQVEMWYSKWVNLAILFGMAVIYRMMFFAIVKVAEGIRPKMRRMKCSLI
ncbi:hypothetical protein EE612_059147 [Oryza sativa]|nr:hypothetical protein EE612_059147 [Oryza sativa]